MREWIPNVCPQITNLEHWKHWKDNSYLYTEETCSRYRWVWWLFQCVTSFPSALPYANPLQNKFLGVSTLGDPMDSHQGGPNLGSCYVWRSLAICAWEEGAQSHLPTLRSWSQWGQGGSWLLLLSPPYFKTVYKIPAQSSHREKNESPTLNPTHLTATDGDIWREGGGAKKIPINLNSMMVTINSTTNVYLSGKHCWAFGCSSSYTWERRVLKVAMNVLSLRAGGSYHHTLAPTSGEGLQAHQLQPTSPLQDCPHRPGSARLPPPPPWEHWGF